MSQGWVVSMNFIEIWYPQSWTFNVECWREVVRIFDRMLERRVSNQRQDLSSDQQMNYLLSWFVNWSDLQKVGQPSICLRCWQWWHWWTTEQPALQPPQQIWPVCLRRTLFLSWLRRCPTSGPQVIIWLNSFIHSLKCQSAGQKVDSANRMRILLTEKVEA